MMLVKELENLLRDYRNIAITNTKEFDEKYKEYVKEGHYGMAIEDPLVLAISSIVFETWFTKMQGFKFSQIKVKFGYSRVYTTLPRYMNTCLEEVIDYILHLNKEESRYKELLTIITKKDI